MPENLGSDNEARTLAIDAQFLEGIKSVHSRYTSDFGPLMYSLVKAIQPALVIETGTCQGYLTCWLGLGAKDIGTKVKTIDWYNEKPPHAHPGSDKLVRENLRRCGVEEYVEIIMEDALVALAETDKTGLGICILDDYHSYDHVMKEVALVYQHLVPGGLILIHDVCHEAMAEIGESARAAAKMWNMKDIWFFRSLGYSMMQKGW